MVAKDLDKVFEGMTKFESDLYRVFTNSSYVGDNHKKLTFYRYEEDFGKWSRISTDEDDYVLEDFDADIRIAYDCIWKVVKSISIGDQNRECREIVRINLEIDIDIGFLEHVEANGIEYVSTKDHTDADFGDVAYLEAQFIDQHRDEMKRESWGVESDFCQTGVKKLIELLNVIISYRRKVIAGESHQGLYGEVVIMGVLHQ